MTILKDLKDALSNARKPDITHVRKAFITYTARPCEFGNVVYERGNYRRPTGDAVHTTPTRADFERYRSYLRAATGHIADVLDAMELHIATDPQLEDVEGMKRAAYAIDIDMPPGREWIGPSNLPHIAPACASLNMAITQAVDCGLLPADPGTPWNTKAVKPDSVMVASTKRIHEQERDAVESGWVELDVKTSVVANTVVGTAYAGRTLVDPSTVFSAESLANPVTQCAVSIPGALGVTSDGVRPFVFTADEIRQAEVDARIASKKSPVFAIGANVRITDRTSTYHGLTARVETAPHGTVNHYVLSVAVSNGTVAYSTTGEYLDAIVYDTNVDSPTFGKPVIK